MVDTNKKHTDILESGTDLTAYYLVKNSPQEDQVKASHILIAYKGATRAAATVTRTKEEAKAEADKLLAQVKAAPDTFNDVAKKDSNDPSAATNGGDLGFFGRGQMTQNFEIAAFSMNVGDISDVVETEFGYHIIKLTDKKQTEATMDLQLIKMANTSDNKAKLAGRAYESRRI